MKKKYLSNFHCLTLSKVFMTMLVLLLTMQNLSASILGGSNDEAPRVSPPVITDLLADNGKDVIAAAAGLWVQNEPINIKGEGYNCGCHVLGLSFAPPRRCYFYFTHNRVVSGYLTAASGLSKDKCANPASWTSEQKSKMLKKLAEVAANKKPGSSSIGKGFTYAVGELNIIQASAPVTIDDETSTGTYYDITFPTPLLTGHSRICSAYLRKGDDLYIAKDPRGGSKPQDKAATICDSQRFTILTEYTRIK